MKQTQKNYSSVVFIYKNKVILRFKGKFYEYTAEFLKNGNIVNKENFINSYNNFLKANHLFKFGIHGNIILIVDELLSNNDIDVFINVFKELNYQNISIVKEFDLLNITDTDSYLINSSHLKLYYLNSYNEIVMVLLDYLTSDEICFIINKRIYNNLLIFNLDNYYNYNKHYFLPDNDKYFFEKLI